MIVEKYEQLYPAFSPISDMDNYAFTYFKVQKVKQAMNAWILLIPLQTDCALLFSLYSKGWKNVIYNMLNVIWIFRFCFSSPMRSEFRIAKLYRLCCLYDSIAVVITKLCHVHFL
jgi:hypothetical protein